MSKQGHDNPRIYIPKGKSANAQIRLQDNVNQADGDLLKNIFAGIFGIKINCAANLKSVVIKFYSYLGL